MPDPAPILTSDVIGVIAGNGCLPAMVVRAARAQGQRVVVAALKGEVDPTLAELCDVFNEVSIGHLGAIVKLFAAHGAATAVMVGGISKQRLFSRTRPDWLAAKLLLRLQHFKDDAALRALAQILGEEGVTIVDAMPYVGEALAPVGPLGKRKPSQGELADVAFGFQVLDELSPVDVGQTVVVRAGVILAVEAIEGTDACIVRGAALGQGSSVITRGDVVVCKGVKRGQDRRFDLPAIGPRTVEVCRQAAVGLLAVEAGGTLVLDRAATVQAADKAKLAIVGVARGAGQAP